MAKPGARAGTVETDYLNGEIVELGRRYDVATPVNALLQKLSQKAARERKPPRSMRAEEVVLLIEKEKRTTKNE